MRTLMVLSAALAAAAAPAVTIGFDDAEALLYDGSNAATASVLDNRYGGLFLSYYRSTDPGTGIPDPYVPVTAIGYADYPDLTPVSGTNAVDGFVGSLIVDLNSAVFPVGSTFGISVVGNGGFGNPNASVRFFDAGGALVDTVRLDLSRAGRFEYAARPFASVQLPSGAYYDDLTIRPVPEPSAFAALAVGGLALARRKRR